MPERIRTFIVDDHAVIRFALEAWAQKTSEQANAEAVAASASGVLTSTAAEIVVVGSADNGTDALRLIPEAQPNVLLIDLQLPDMQGTEVIRQLRASGWDKQKLPILLMTGMETAQVKDILASGANGYLSKQESSETFIAALRHIVKYPLDVWLNPAVAKQMLSAEKAFQEAGITAAEKNVLRLIRLSNEEIGELLGISKGTVKNHVANIFQKLGITEREEAVQFAVKTGLIPRLRS